MKKIERLLEIEDHYEVLGLFGDGGQGDLFVGRHHKTGAKVALKTQKARDLGPLSDFQWAGSDLHEEGDRMLQLAAIQAIPDILHTGTYKGRECLVMEFIEGNQLRDAVMAKRPVRDTRIVASIIGQLCEILREVHDKKLVHCDLKPENVIVEPDGRLRLIDMGHAVRVGATTHEPHGTRGYASPEQSDASDQGLTERADIFGLGCILLEMTVMRLPYGGLEERAERECPVLPPDRLAALPPEFAALALQMVRWKAEDRPSDVQEVFDRLRRHLPPLGSSRPSRRLRPDPTEYYRNHPPRL
ncbi:serine/threonine protein kinase [Streptomyces sp. NPDC088258]|uniref:serine/threonine protein kinase n=1 Tax=Streptomyces sp. NPDC088258 TaxID=3365849 RepID=UPI003804DAB4